MGKVLDSLQVLNFSMKNILNFIKIYCHQQIICYRGMDPLMIAALSGAVAAGVCFMGGSALYIEVWKLANKKKHQQILQVREV